MAKITNGRLQEGGRLAVHKNDFNVHVSGEDFRHSADNIDLDAIVGLDSSNMQTALESLADIVGSFGSGFISIGSIDGYAQGNYNVGATGIVTLEDAFDAALADDRLQNGGVILLLAGTYVVESSITIPSGYAVIGEIQGTIINGEMSEEPIFIISKGIKDIKLGGNAGLGEISIFSGSNFNKVLFSNLILVDNLNKTGGSGEAASMTTVPMISCQKGSNFECERVSFLGRVTNGSPTGRTKTQAGIGYSGGVGDSRLSVKNCFFDGVQVGINFNSDGGSSDFLEVVNCKARTWGNENGFETTKSRNCFVAMNGCNATLVNNHHIGQTTNVSACYVVMSVVSGTGKYIVSGTTGGPTTLSTSNAFNLFYDESDSDLRVIKSNNYWGGTLNNEWFVVVGNAQPSVGSSTYTGGGDFNGTGAIDLLLTHSSGIYAPTTIIVNPGNYIITSSTEAANFNFIGNKRGGNYPVFYLNCSITDSITGNKNFEVGSYIKSIKFNADSSFTSFYHTITGNTSNNGFFKVEDCFFINCALILETQSAVTEDGYTVHQGIHLVDCDFSQNNSFTDNISLLLPSANKVILDNCTFSGHHYVGGIGEISSYSHANTRSEIILNNCTMDMTGGTIDAQSPMGSLRNNYFWIIDPVANITLNNCKIVCSDEFDVTAPINTTLTSSGDFTRFLYFLGKTVEIDHCTFNGPYQFYTDSGSDYAMITAQLGGTEMVKVTNSRFLGGACPVKIGDMSTFTSESEKTSIIFDNCDISVKQPNDFYNSLTLLDIDLNRSSLGDDDPEASVGGQILVTNSTFWNMPGPQSEAHDNTTNYATEHTNLTSGYNAQGCVQIYANFFDVIVSNCKIAAHLKIDVDDSFTHLGGLVVDNYTGSAPGVNPRSVNITNNNIYIETRWNTADAAESASNIYVKSSVLNIHNNSFGFDSDGTLNANFVGNLYIDNTPTVSNTYSQGIVSGNNFSRRKDTGSASSMNLGFVKIASTSGKGSITNNVFSDSTYDGSTTTLINDDTTYSNKWYKFGNVNASTTAFIHGYQGIRSETGNLSSTADASSTTATVTYTYTASSAGTCYWIIPLIGILPQGAYVVSASLTAEADQVFTNGEFIFRLVQLSRTTVTSTIINFEGSYTPGDPLTATLTPTNSSLTTTFKNDGPVPYLEFLNSGNISDAGSGTIILGQILLTYRF